MKQLPQQIAGICTSEALPCEGAMIFAEFCTTVKNHYSIIFGPTDKAGVAKIEWSEIIRQACEQLAIGLKALIS